MADEDVLAAPEAFAGYIGRIKAGFILLQMGIGGGIIDGCLGVIRLADVSGREINRYLDDGFDALQTALNQAWEETCCWPMPLGITAPNSLPTLKTALGRF